MLKRLTLLSLCFLPVRGFSDYAAVPIAEQRPATNEVAAPASREPPKSEAARWTFKQPGEAEASEPDRELRATNGSAERTAAPRTESQRSERESRSADSVAAIADRRDIQKEEDQPVQGEPALGDEEPAPRRLYREALWVWTDEITSEHRRTRLIQDASAHGYNTLYLNVYRPTPNSDSRRMYENDDMATLIREARDVGVEVWAAYGNPDWVDLGVTEGSPPKERFDELIEYNDLHPEAEFAGIILDVEPPEPVDQGALVHFFSEALEYLAANSVPAAAAIRYFWTKPAAGPAGETRPAHEHLIEMDFDHVVVMGYRNYAGEPAQDNGIIAINKDHVRFAQRARRDRSVLIGLRTTGVGAEGGHPVETFFGSSPSKLYSAKARVERHFAENRGFGGFATHRYNPSGLATSFPAFAAND